MKFDLTQCTYRMPSKDLSSTKLNNFYVIKDERSDTNPTGSFRGKAALFPTPGKKLMINLSGSSVRGMIEHEDRLFAVMDDKFYELTYSAASDSMTSTLRGTLSSNSGNRVSMAINLTQIIIVDGSANGYIFNHSTNTFAAIADADFFGGDTVVHIDSYFFYNRIATSNVYASAPNDGTTYAAIDTVTAEFEADKLVAVGKSLDELFLFGKHSTEIWVNTAEPVGFPFSRREGGLLTVGCAAAHTVKTFDNSIFWLSDSGFVIKMDGYRPKIISTPALHYIWKDYTSISDAFAFTYVDNGRLFYVLTFPTGDATFVYDASSDEWHERSSRNELSGDVAVKYGRDRANCHAQYLNGRHHFVGDYNSGKIFRLSETVYTEDSNPITRDCITKHGFDENKRRNIYKLTLNCETGVGLTTGQGSSPQIMLSISKDGGQTWGTEFWRSLGKQGNYGDLPKWTRLGMAKEWTFWLRYSDPTPIYLFDFSAEIGGE